jgi:hypothetical protein
MDTWSKEELLRAELPLVPGSRTAEGGANYGRWHDEGSRL